MFFSIISLITGFLILHYLGFDLNRSGNNSKTWKNENISTEPDHYSSPSLEPEGDTADLIYVADNSLSLFKSLLLYTTNDNPFTAHYQIQEHST